MIEDFETETIDKLYLELSQFTNAVTNKESNLRDRADELSYTLRQALKYIEEGGSGYNRSELVNRIHVVLSKGKSR